jgi:LytS/YehU family sensor histidine kinase
MTISRCRLLVAPWTALAAIVRQKEAFARNQKLAFELERSELERQALDARLHLLQAQVAPHFLFNTLANVQALVDAGSPHASTVLQSLVAYLRAAVPLLHEPAATIERAGSFGYLSWCTCAPIACSTR